MVDYYHNSPGTIVTLNIAFLAGWCYRLKDLNLGKKATDDFSSSAVYLALSDIVKASQQGKIPS